MEEKGKEKERGDSDWALWTCGRSANLKKKYTGFLIRKLPFVRQVMEITQEQWGDLRLQALALLAF